MINCFRSFINKLKKPIQDNHSQTPQTETSATTKISSSSGKCLFAVHISGQPRLCTVSYSRSATLGRTYADARTQIAASSQDGTAGPISFSPPQLSAVGANGSEQYADARAPRDETLSTVRDTGSGKEESEETWSLSYASPPPFTSTVASWTIAPPPLSSAATSVSGSSSGRISKPHGHPDRQGWVSPSRRSSSTTVPALQSVGPDEPSPSKICETRKGHGHPHSGGVADFTKPTFSRDEFDWEG